MRAVVQRVLRAEVRVGGETVGRCGPGMLVLVGVLRGDGLGDAARLAQTLARLRFFRGADGRMERDAAEAGAEVLLVSQVTLAADVGKGGKGRRPSLERAAPPEMAEALYREVARRLRELGVPVSTGRFGAAMEIELVNDGPVTFVVEEPPRDAPGSG